MTPTLDPMDEEEQDRFEAHYFGDLSEQEMEKFDAQLGTDAAFRERYLAFRLAVKGIRSLRPSESKQPDTSDLRDRLLQVDAELDNPGRDRAYWPLLAMAAALILALGIWWILLPAAHVRLADEFTLPEPGLPVLMHTGQGDHDRIMNAYKQGHLNEAGALLDEQLVKDPTNDTLHYFAGVVAEQRYSCRKAIVHYDQAIKDPKFSERAAYRKAICLLRDKDIEGARRVLSTLVKASEPHIGARARDLLERL